MSKSAPSNSEQCDKFNSQLACIHQITTDASSFQKSYKDCLCKPDKTFLVNEAVVVSNAIPECVVPKYLKMISDKANVNLLTMVFYDVHNRILCAPVIQFQNLLEKYL